jgi:hypothetical protein
MSTVYPWLIEVGLGSACVFAWCIAQYVYWGRRRCTATSHVFVIRCPEYGPDSIVQIRTAGSCCQIEDCSQWPRANCRQTCAAVLGCKLGTVTSPDANVAADA